MTGRHPDQHGRHDDTQTYSLDELANEADVTPRTIRYYIAEGLLPPPLSPGRNARYTQEHLNRLRMITQMKARYLPLKEIRRTLTTMSPEQIRRRTARAPRARAMESRSAPEPSSTQDYIAHALEESAPAYGVQESLVSQGRPRRDYATRQSWKRIPVTDDAEFLITDDAWDRRGEQIEPALEWIRRILNE